jgi:predicted nucleotidyltransferase
VAKAEHPSPSKGPGRASAETIIDELRQGIDGVLPSCVEGIYVFGSYVLGDFDERLSDVDLLVTTACAVTDEQLHQLTMMHTGLVGRHPDWGNRVEVIYVDTATLRSFREGGEVIRVSPGEPLHRTPFLQHWLVDLYTVQEAGLTLQGVEPVEVVPTITQAEFKACISAMVVDWLDWMSDTLQERYLAYIRLALCRSLFAYRFGRQASKAAAATWVRQEYAEWADLADEAIRWREADSQRPNGMGLQRTEAFGRFVCEATRP